MITIRVSGPQEDIDSVLDIVRANVPNIIKENSYDSRDEDGVKLVYFNISDELQRRSKDNLQDWAIIEFCNSIRTTSDIKNYFDIGYSELKEILDRLVGSKDLVRRLEDKHYCYLDAKMANCC